MGRGTRKPRSRSAGTEEDLRAVIYVRISSDPAGERAGVERQRKECEELADRLSLTVVGLYEDNDISAYSGKVRPAFESMIADAAAGDFGHVVAWASDRLYRRMADLVRITDDLASHVAIHTVAGGDVDLESAEGIMRAQVMGSVGEFESRRKGERLAARARQRAENGVMTASNRPFGWRWREPCPGDDSCRHRTRCQPGQRARLGSRAGLEPDPVEAPLVADAYRAVAAGLTLQAAWRQVTAAGLPVVEASGLGLVLRNPRHAGLVAHQGVIVGEARDRQAIVDRDLWEKANVILTDPSRRTSPGRPANTILGGGLLRCGRCGGNMSASRKNGAAVYICSRNLHLRSVRARIDTAAVDVIGDVVAALADTGTLSVPATEDTRSTDLRHRIADTEQRLEALAGLLAAGELDPADYATATRKLRTTLEGLSADLTRRIGRPALADLADDPSGVKARWSVLRTDAENGNVDVMRAVLGELLETIEMDVDHVLHLHWRSWVGPAPDTVVPKGTPTLRAVERKKKVLKMAAAGMSQVAIARELGCNRTTVRGDLGLLRNNR